MRLILVGCVSQKATVPLPARDLYVSPLFRKRREYAERSGLPWLILSAHHGLIPPDRVIHPYNARLTKPRIASWSYAVRMGLVREGIADGDTLEVHAGTDYLDGVERACRWLETFAGVRVTIDAPLRGLGIGQQLAWYPALPKGATHG